MKKMIMLALLVVSQIAFAATEVKSKAMTPAEAQARLQANAEFRDFSAKVAKGEKLSTKEKSFVQKALTSMLEKTGVSSTSLQLLVEMKPEVLALIMEKTSIVLDKSDVKKSEKAKVDLDILSALGKSIDVNSKDAAKNLEVAKKVTELADYNKLAAEFRAEFLKQLETAPNAEAAAKAAYKKVMGKELDMKNFEECFA